MNTDSHAKLQEVTALVAEHVLGWRNNWDTPGDGGMWGIMDWLEEDDGTRTPVRAADFDAYAFEMEYAWEVVEHLRPINFRLEQRGTEQRTWMCRMYLSDGRVGYCDASTAALAICIAALRCVGLEMKP